MKLTSGLFDRMVLQRRRGNVCDVIIAGTCRTSGDVKITVRAGGRVLRGHRDRRIGRAAGGRFQGRLTGLPTGGPYELALAIAAPSGRAESAQVRQVLVGDVWILAGQSNMQGAGERAQAPRPHRLVRACYMHDRWDIARDPIHNLWNAVDPVHGGRPDGTDGGWTGGVGPGIAFGQELLRRTGVPQGLIACAHGGTSMAMWDPALKSKGGASFYGAMLRRFHKYGRRVAGVFWYQGESDTDAASAPHYTARMQTLVRAMRHDLMDARLPIVTVQLAWYGGADAHVAWNDIQDQQRLLPARIPRLAVVPTIDLPLVDHIHLNAPAQAVLGRRAAEAMCVLREGRKAGTPPIALKSVRLEPYDAKGHVNIVVEFDHVVGGLQAAVRPFGFAVCGETGPVSAFFGTKLDGNKVVLPTTQLPAFLLERGLHYGYGMNPACNIQDGRGRSLPVLGPVRMGRPGHFTPFVRSLRLSPLLAGGGDLGALPYPPDPNALAATRHASPYEFIDMHAQFAAAGEAHLFFACRLACSEPMRLAMLLGYDGPVKAWIDGEVVLHDPHGHCPAQPDARRIAFRSRGGEHDVVIALGSAGGQAWGIFLRFERLGTGRRLPALGAALPRVLS